MIKSFIDFINENEKEKENNKGGIITPGYGTKLVQKAREAGKKLSTEKIDIIPTNRKTERGHAVYELLIPMSLIGDEVEDILENKSKFIQKVLSWIREEEKIEKEKLDIEKEEDDEDKNKDLEED